MKKFWALIIFLSVLFIVVQLFISQHSENKIARLNLIARVPAASPPVQPPPSKKIIKVASEKNLADFFRKLDPKGDWKFNKDQSEQVYSMMGGFIPHALDNANLATEIAKNLATKLGHTEEEITLDSEFLKQVQNPLTLVYNYKQKFDNYEVYNSYLRLFGRKDDGSLYFVNNELKDIGTPSSKIQFDKGQIPSVIEQRFSEKTYQIEEIAPLPVFYVVSPGNSELTWKVTVKLSRPLNDRRLLFISTQSGELIQDYSLKLIN